MRTCKLCGGNTVKYKPMTYRRVTEWVKCGSCGFEFVEPTPSADELKRYYATSEYRDETTVDVPFWASLHHEDDRARQWFEYLVEGDTLLDVGSGAGASMKAFEELGFEVSGVEPGPWGRSYDAYESLEEVEGEFDVVTCFHVLEHALDPLEFLAQLKPLVGKQLCIETPKYPGNRAWPHLSNFSVDTLLLAMELADMPAKLCDANYHIKVTWHTPLS